MSTIDLQRNNKFLLIFVLLLLSITIIIFFSTENYLLFHTLIELTSIVIGISIFFHVWNSYKTVKDTYLVIIGISYLFISIIDLLHTLTYKGMNIIIEENVGNIATQLWIAARYLQSISILLALTFSRKKINTVLMFSIYAVISALLILSIFQWRVFPVCFINGEGLTRFKISSEYIISVILLLAIFSAYRKRKIIPVDVFYIMLLFIIFTIISELAFTFYISVYGISNLIGHIFKLFACMSLYQSIFISGLMKPQNLLFSIMDDEEEIKKNNELILMALANNYSNAYFFLIERDFSISFSSESTLSNENFMNNKKVTSTINNAFNGIYNSIETENNGFYTLFKAVPLFISEQYVPRVMLIIEDITKKRRANRLKTIKWEFENYAKNHSLEEIIKKLIQECETLTGSQSGYFYFVKEEMSFLNSETIYNNEKSESLRLCILERVPFNNQNRTRERELLVPLIKDEDLTAVLRVAHKHTTYNDDDIETLKALIELGWETIIKKQYDITLKKREQELIKLEAALTRCSISIIILDLKGRIEFVNKKFSNNSGYSSSEIIGKEPVILHADDVNIEDYEELWNTVNNGNKWKGVFHNSKKSGELYWVETIVSPIYNKKGDITNFLWVNEDITQKLANEEEKRNLEKKLQHRSKMDSLGQLAGGMAHDFNNTLSGILGASELLKELSTENENMLYIDLIIKSTLQAAELTSKLLTFSRKSNFEFKVIDLHNLITDSITILQRTIDKKVHIHSNLDANDYSINADYTAIENCLINLGINAHHAMPLGGELKIETSNINIGENYCNSSTFELKPGEYIRLVISDTGTGISPEVLNNIFEPFYTTKHNGTGLGLSSVYGTIMEHSGEIRVYSELNAGTSFIILLPITEKNIIDMKNKELIHRGTGVILYVDDDELNRIIGKDLINSLGYNAIIASSANEAINIYNERKSEISLILTDMIMPDMDGYELFQELKKIDEKVKVILTSGFIGHKTNSKIIDMGFTSFIQKPYRLETLSKILHDNIG